MKKLVLLVPVLALTPMGFLRCAGSPPPGTDGGNKDSGNNSGNDSGNNPGADAGTDAGTCSNPYTGLGAYCSTADGGTACSGTGMGCGTLPGASGGACTTQCTGSCGPCSCEATTGGGVCYLGCSPDGGATCATDSVCAGVSGGGFVCFPDCTIHPDVCGPDGGGFGCNASFRICTPVGGQGFGFPCGSTAGACQSGLLCIYVSSPSDTFCSADCTTAACPSPGQCLLNDPANGKKYCAIPCPDGGSCPNGLTCVAGDGLCE